PSSDQDSAPTPQAALPPRVQATFLDRIATAVACPRPSLDEVAAHATRTQVPIADALVSFGRVSEQVSYETLATVTGMTFVPLTDTPPAALAVRMVPARVARKHQIVPLAVTNRTLRYATCRPFDDDAERDVAFTSGRRPEAVLTTRTDLNGLIERSYPKSSELEIIVARLRSDSVIETITEFDASAQSDSAVIELCNHLIARAVEAGSSDIHVESSHEGAVVRFRVSGIMEPVATIPPAAAPAVCNRFKIMARADISSRMRPQDGAFALLLDGRRIDVRFSSVPTVGGEKLVMRVIDSRSQFQTLDDLAYPPDIMVRLRQALIRPDGLVLVTGPTGSGKTTALYAALDVLRARAVNIVTVEDPVERQVAGITQIPVNNRAGNTFATVLRSVLRQDPNVIMVGEIRDAEVAGILGQAAYTGHLVLSSLHTTDSITAIVRLLNLGLEPFKVAESLSAILAQRLVRKLCPHCRIVHSEFDARRLGEQHHVPRVAASAGPGCPSCRFTGYLGRLAVAELLMPDAAMRDAIGRGAQANELRAAMRAAGQSTMRDRGVQYVAEGLTSLEEVNRVLAVEETAAAPVAPTGRILVAEDDAITRMLVKLLLERDGYTVLEASNGRQAVEIAAREHPSLVVMDLNMPEMNGYEAIAHLRRVPALSAMPVMVLTSEEGPGVETTVLELGADDYVVKPFDAGV
ncbi:MAG TPA: type II/IV secretion system protein, partial [Methylomirabilota bacterium]|nr:type II/IV secretion system protein [Methylomirabilota bacterium]